MAPVLVQSNKFDRGFAGSTTAPIAFPGALTSGNILVAMATIGANTTVTFSDTVNTWTTVSTRYWANVGETLAIGWAQNTSSSALTVTATFGASASFGSIVAAEFSGVATTSPVDVFTLGKDGSASATPVDVSMTPTVDGDLIIGAIAPEGVVVTAGSGFTLIQANTGTTGSAMQYQVQPTAGAVAVPWNLASATQYVTLSAAFKASGGAPPSAPPILVMATRR